MLFNPDFEICALGLMIVITIFFFSKDKLHSLSSTIFGFFILITMADLFFDVIGVVTITYSTRIPLWVNYLINTMYYLQQASLSFIFMLFAMSITDTLHFKRRSPVYFLFIPYIFCVGLIFCNIYSGYFFYFDDFTYFHGSLIWLMYVFAAFYVALGLYYVFRYRNRISAAQFRAIIIFAIIMTVAVLLQYLFPEYLLTGAFVALAILTIYLSIQNPDDYIDKMTGLYGRSAFLYIIETILKKQHTRQKLIVIDINKLKSINNLFGLAGGDICIIQIADFLSTITRKRRHLFRISGDKFALLVNENLLEETKQSIIGRFTEPWSVLDSKIHIDTTLCFMDITQLASSNEQVMIFVENSIMQAKQSNTPVFNVSGDTVNILSRRIDIENTLRNIQKNNSIFVHFQPVFSVSDNKITGAEALLRLYDPITGNVPPTEFIPIAEQTGLICQIGQIVLDQSYKFIAENELWKLGIDTMHINLSPVECMQEDLVDRFYDLLERYPQYKTKLNLEITETAAATSPQQVEHLMNCLTLKGITFSLDDYGQGYSNHSSLINLPFNTIKFDKSMLDWCDVSEKARTVYLSCIDMIKKLNLKIVSEGAERKDQVDMLLSSGVDYIQGYYYGRPMPGNEFIEYVTKYNF